MRSEQADIAIDSKKVDTDTLQPWTLRVYETICISALEGGYNTCSVERYLTEKPSLPLILRHDVDRFPKNALAMANLENRLGIRSTYYFRTIGSSFDPDIIKAVRALGHEIGYHFEVLSRAHGDFKAAQQLLQDDLVKLRELATVTTCSAHGSPLSKWDNRNFWDRAETESFGLIGDAYRDIDFSDVVYLTDTGRSWTDDECNMRDRVEGASAASVRITTSDELVNSLKCRHFEKLCLQTHPERWNDGWIGTARSFAMDSLTNAAKRTLRRLR